MKVFDLLSHPICFASVHRLSPSTWTGHLPFAMFATDVLRPRVIVELGSYYGTSYCAFCQAVEELQLDTKCFAVDTWEGDPQSGFYGDEIYQDLKTYHDRLYSGFSRLVRGTFDEAVEHFSDGSIDLLHIDGFHTYEAVKQDFETWLPKISARGVILFHDINVREKDFGAWKFWEEIRARYDHFDFSHSHGLGVLAVGAECPDEFKEFLKFADANRTQVTNFFFQLGQRLIDQQELIALRDGLEKHRQIISGLTAQNESAEQLRQTLEIRERELSEELEASRQRLLDVAEKEKQLDEKGKTLDENTEENERMTAEAELQKQQLDELEQKLAEFEEELAERQKNLEGKEWELQRALVRARRDQSAEQNQALIVSAGGKRRENAVQKLIIGVVTYNNSPEQIAQLVSSIELAGERLKELPVEIETLLIDNGRTTVWPDSRLSVVRLKSEGNIGFGRGMNRLMEAAFSDTPAEWFLCLNPDGVLHRDALRELITMSNQFPNSLIEARQFPEEHNKLYDPITFETPWASGACLLINYDIYKKIGGFDANIFMYLEDVDLSWRARSEGFSVKVAARAIFGHAVLHREFNPETDKYLLLSGRYLGAKWNNPEFVRWSETELVKRGYFHSAGELPAFPAARSPQFTKPEISNFEHYFSFSPTRW